MRKFASQGFTLLEAVVALAILGLAGVAALEAMSGELRAAERGKRATTAAALAEYRLAVIAMLPRADLDPVADSIARGTFQQPFEEYQWRTGVRPVLDEPDLYDVTVAVVKVRNEVRQIKLTTRIFRPPAAGMLR